MTTPTGIPDLPPDAEPTELVPALNALRVAYKANAKAQREVANVLRRRIGWQNLWLVVLGAVIVLAVFIGWQFRQQAKDFDDHQRHVLIQGCERGNDLRATLAQVIEDSYAPAPISPTLSPELAALVRESQARAALRKVELLALPGIQRVDCQAAFPDSTRH